MCKYIYIKIYIYLILHIILVTGIDKTFDRIFICIPCDDMTLHDKYSIYTN